MILIKVFTTLLPFTLVYLPSCKGAANVNGLIDPLIQDVIKNLKSKKETSVNVPNMVYTLHDKGSPPAGVKTLGGVFSDLSTVHRVGNAVFDIKGPSATLRATLSLKTANLDFRRVVAWYGSINISDKLSISVKNNALEVQITVTFSAGGCKATVDKVALTQFSNITVDLKNAGDGINKTINKYVNSNNAKIKSAIEGKMKTSLQDSIGKRNMCAGVLGG